MRKSLTQLYVLLIIICIPSLYYWLTGVNWNINNLTVINTFPIFGLLAFNIMWLHLMIAWYRRYNPDKFNYKKFFRQTSNLVLALIIIHPMLIIWKSLSIGVKPLDFAGNQGRISILFGAIALTIFLLYEVIDRMRQKPVVQNNWPYVVAINRAGLILIYFHALKLGTNLQDGPFKLLWIFYGISLVAYYLSSYIKEIPRDNQPT